MSDIQEPSASLPVPDQCEVNCVDSHNVAKVKKARMPAETVTEMAAIFQALGDPTRVRIIHALIQAELCVCDLAVVLEMTQSAVSHQLRFLHTLRIVKRRKAGRMVYYSIDDGHILTLFHTGYDHVSHR